jgi:hypothetical protein
MAQKEISGPFFFYRSIFYGGLVEVNDRDISSARSYGV